MYEQRFLECLDADFTRLQWTGTDLTRHVADVYLHKTETLRQGKWPTPWPPELPDVPAALEAAYRQLVGEFTARDLAVRR